MSDTMLVTVIASGLILLAYVALVALVWRRGYRPLSESDRGPVSYRANLAGLILYTTLIGVISLATLFIGGRPIARLLLSADWPSAAGTVVDTRVERITIAGRGVAAVRWQPQVVYEYEVDGEPLRNDDISFADDPSFSDPETAAERLEPYTVGEAVRVVYNPDDPEMAVLERDVETENYLIVGGALLLMGVHLIGTINRARLGRPIGRPFTGPYHRPPVE